MGQEQLEQAVEKALNSQEGNDEQVKETTPAETKEKETQDVNLDERTTQALQLLEALENPATARRVVEDLARQAGLLSGDQTKKEQQQTIKGIKQTVKEKLGENGAFLANELGEALEEIISSEIGKVRSEFESYENQRQAAILSREYDEIIEREKVTPAEAESLMKLADEMPWNGKTSLNSYLTKLIKLHRSEVAEKTKKDELKQRQQRNIQSQTKTQGVESNEERVKRGSEKISAHEAVLAALRGESLE